MHPSTSFDRFITYKNKKWNKFQFSPRIFIQLISREIVSSLLLWQPSGSVFSRKLTFPDTIAQDRVGHWGQQFRTEQCGKWLSLEFQPTIERMKDDDNDEGRGMYHLKKEAYTVSVRTNKIWHHKDKNNNNQQIYQLNNKYLKMARNYLPEMFVYNIYNNQDMSNSLIKLKYINPHWCLLTYVLVPDYIITMYSRGIP